MRPSGRSLSLAIGAVIWLSLFARPSPVEGSPATDEVVGSLRHDPSTSSGQGEKGEGPVQEEDLAKASSLNLVLRYAQQQNPAIRAARHQWAAMKARIVQEQAYDNPTVTFSPDTGNMAETRAGPQGNGVGFSQSIPFPGKLSLRGDIADQQARATYEHFQATMQEISRQVRVRYADYYLAARSLETNADTTELMRQFATIAAAKYKVGSAAQQDVIMAQEQLSRLANQRVIFEGNREMSLGALNALLDRPPRAPLGAPADLDAVQVAVPLATLVDVAGGTRPEIRSQDHLVEASHRSLTLAKMGYLPDFSIGGQYIEVGGGTNPAFVKDGHDIWTARIGLSIPIWIDRVRSRIDEMQAEVLQREFQRRDIVTRVADQVQHAYERARVAARTDAIYRTTLIPQTEERIAAARAGYQSGLVDFLTLIDSLKSLEGVRLEHYQAVRNSQQAVADLERAVGEPLVDVGAPEGGGE